MAEERRNPCTASGLFLMFAKLSMIGFGGVMPWARRRLVEQDKILTPEEFAEILAFAQLLPGPTVCNIALIVGQRKLGMLGSAAALSGMVIPPSLAVLAIGYFYGRFADGEIVQSALRGMAVAAAALVAGMGLKMAKSLPAAPRPILFAGAMFASVGLMHWPLLAVMSALILPSLAIARWTKWR